MCDESWGWSGLAEPCPCFSKHLAHVLRGWERSALWQVWKCSFSFFFFSLSKWKLQANFPANPPLQNSECLVGCWHTNLLLSRRPESNAGWDLPESTLCSSPLSLWHCCWRIMKEKVQFRSHKGCLWKSGAFQRYPDIRERSFQHVL